MTGRCLFDRAKAFEARLHASFLRAVFPFDDEIPADMAEMVRKMDDAA